MNLPLAAINIDTASLIEMEVNAMQSQTNLANGIANESLQREVFWNAIHSGAKRPNEYSVKFRLFSRKIFV